MTTPFVMLEQRLPAWRTARAIIEPLVPQRLTFIADARGTSISIDWRWAQRIVDLAPPEDEAATLAMVNAMIDAVSAQIPQAAFDQYLSMPIDARTLGMMNDDLHRLDQEARAARRATFIEHARHHLGLARAYGPEE